MNEKEKKGMRVIPVGERKCIWMDAGVVSYKLCTNQYQCHTCEFDLAMSARAKKERTSVEVKSSVSDKKRVVEWMEEFRHLPADQRKCRYMLSGEVSHKICPNSFRCGDCTFDQMMQDRLQPVMAPKMDALPKVSGYYIDENRFYFRNHTWIQLERNGKYRIGIDDFARRVIGKVDSIDLPATGKAVGFEEFSWTIHHAFGDIEFFSPVEGVVESVNYTLLENPSLVSEQPYADGWLIEIEPKSIGRSMRNFLKGKEATDWLSEEAVMLHKEISPEAGPTLHDGAAVTEDISSHLSKEKWTEIVKKHLFSK